MNNGKVDWQGNFVAVATPFKKDGSIDEPAFQANVKLMLSEGAHGIVVCGCTGEAWALEPAERMRLFKLARDVAGKTPVVGGVSTVLTDKVVEMAKGAVAAGCDGVMIMPPYYAVIGTREIRAHFKAISDQAKVPIMLYNMPKRTNIDMSPSFIAELADLEWIVALKQSSNDFNDLEATLAAAGEKINVFAGHSAERGFAAVMMGCPGFVSSMESQVMGREAISMYELAKAKKVKEGMAVQQRCITLDKGMRKIGTFPSNMKGAMNLRGRPGGYCRQPLLDLDAGELARASEVLAGLNLLDRANAA